MNDYAILDARGIEGGSTAIRRWKPGRNHENATDLMACSLWHGESCGELAVAQTPDPTVVEPRRTTEDQDARTIRVPDPGASTRPPGRESEQWRYVYHKHRWWYYSPRNQWLYRDSATKRWVHFNPAGQAAGRYSAHSANEPGNYTTRPLPRRDTEQPPANIGPMLVRRFTIAGYLHRKLCLAPLAAASARESAGSNTAVEIRVGPPAPAGAPCPTSRY